jgi:site-specific DNA-methyltransferase (cytosine-N4-specific)
MHVDDYYSTSKVAKLAGIHKDTLLRWLRNGLIPEPSRDRHGWRSFSYSELNNILNFTQSSASSQNPLFVSENSFGYINNLKSIDWDFFGAKTSYLTHGIHPYPAKFIPQIPNALIQELSSVGETVGDIFCGSGTTLVEALSLKRNAIGIDANPLACLISKAKTVLLSDSDTTTLSNLCLKAKNSFEELSLSRQGTLFNQTMYKSSAWRPDSNNLNFWFTPSVIEELAECLSWCNEITSENAKSLALTAFSSIIVAVSKQDSDTRYVRREKFIEIGDVFKKFYKSLENCIRASLSFSELTESRFSCNIYNSNLLDPPDIDTLDLIVCSPPYPNAFSYHLYHRTRMLWLQMNQIDFKSVEIGSHRKYSSKSSKAASIDTFKLEFSSIFKWVKSHLKYDGFACFVIGDSIIRGEVFKNASILSALANSFGFKEVASIERSIQNTKKSFNPSIGNIKNETILILQNSGRQI